MKLSRDTLFQALFASSLLLFAAGSASAQDVMKVSPETHTILLENDQVRVLNVHIKPGEKVGMHSHPGNVGHYLSDGKVRITLPDGKTQEREVKAGATVWNDAVTHAVENIGASELQEIQIEVKSAQKPAVAK